MGRVPRRDPIHHLIQVQIARVEFHGIFGFSQGSYGARAVGLVAALEVGEHIFENRRLPLGLEFQEPSPGPGLGAGGEEDFAAGLGEHHGADVPAIHHPATARADVALLVHQHLAHPDVGAHGRDQASDLLAADGLADILARQVHPPACLAEIQAGQ